MTQTPEHQKPRASGDGLDPFVPFEGLQSLGITFCRQYLREMIVRGDFPAATRVGRRRIGWRLSELRRWMAARPKVVLKGAAEAEPNKAENEAAA